MTNRLVFDFFLGHCFLAYEALKSLKRELLGTEAGQEARKCEGAELYALFPVPVTAIFYRRKVCVFPRWPVYMVLI